MDGPSSPPPVAPPAAAGDRLSVHRFCWAGLVLPLAGLGMVVAVLALPPAEVLLRVYAGLLLGPAGSLLVRELLEACGTTTPRPWSAAVAGALALVAAAGVGVLVGEGAVLLLAALVVLGSPSALRCYGMVLRARLRSVLAGDPGRELPPSVLAWPLLAALAVRQLGDAELAAAWQHSGRALQQAGEPDQRLGWVLARQAYLEELERRSPEGPATWLPAWTGPGDPSRLIPPPGRSDPDPA